MNFVLVCLIQPNETFLSNLHDCSTLTLSIFHIEQFAIVHPISLGFYKPKVIK